MSELNLTGVFFKKETIAEERERRKSKNRHVVRADGLRHCSGLPGFGVNRNRCVADCAVGLCDAYVACLLLG